MHRLACALFLTLGFMNFASASDHLRDYYQEPGLNPFKEDTGTANFESIVFSDTYVSRQLLCPVWRQL